MTYIPMVQLVKYTVGIPVCVCCLYIVNNPCYKMVLGRSFDNLM